MKQVIILTFSLFIFAAIVVIIPQKQSIVFQPNHSTDRFVYLPIKGEKSFHIKYTHSIHLSDVVESYKITTNQEIQQYELMYEDFAIGMPANADEGETFEHVDGKYYIKNMNRIFQSFHLRIGQVRANHRVIYKKHEYVLTQFLKPGTSVKIEVRKLNILQQWKGVNILEFER
ncbi:DUF1850 domain-containing protein [Bacillus sp. MRMR6]|uniref:DUF1850 domain-containing protein n=1 Tax=Bacillus sp. MRMR6 TaxID=1928617 RepID=UPI0009FB6EB8|nr:DUF1850 domain-containing protein [Bacillus sp. MRMR6]